MRIAYLVPTFPVASETFVAAQIAGVLDAGHEVDIYAQRPPHPPVPTLTRVFDGRVRYDPQVPSGVVARVRTAGALAKRHQAWRRPGTVLRALNVFTHGRGAASLRLYYAAAPFLHQGAYDVVHCQFGPEGLRALPLRRIGALTGRLYVSFRGYDATKFPKGRPDVYRDLFREAALCLPVSEALADRIVELGCPREKIAIMPSGIDVGRFTFRTRTRNPEAPLELLSVGRFVEKKGIEYGIRAAAVLLKRGYRIVYTIVGDGPLRDELTALAKSLDAAGAVSFAGWQTPAQVHALYDRAHVVIAPSVTAQDGDQEGIPNVLKEAMACGIPVVATRHSGIPELVDEPAMGFLVPERDAEALAERIGLLHDRPELWAEMGQAARQRVESRYDIRALTARLIDLYRDPARKTL